MTNEPFALTQSEWTEIGALEDIRQMWGVEKSENFADFATENIYGAKFRFYSGSPGYIGDLYILQGDTLTGDPPLVLRRDDAGKMLLLKTH